MGVCMCACCILGKNCIIQKGAVKSGNQRTYSILGVCMCVCCISGDIYAIFVLIYENIYSISGIK